MWWEILYHVKLALVRGQLWSNHPHAASVPADRLRTLSQRWISPPRAGSSRLTRHFGERVDVLLPLGKGKYNSRLSFQVRASTNICRKAPAPHYRCSSPSPQLSYLCRALKRGVGVSCSAPTGSALHLVQKHWIFPLWGEQMFKVRLAQRTSALNWVIARASSRDSTKK